MGDRQKSEYMRAWMREIHISAGGGEQRTAGGTLKVRGKEESKVGGEKRRFVSSALMTFITQRGVCLR